MPQAMRIKKIVHQISVLENVTTDDVLLDVNATDPDAMSNNIIYGIAETFPVDAPFAVDPETGKSKITLATSAMTEPHIKPVDVVSAMFQNVVGKMTLRAGEFLDYETDPILYLIILSAMDETIKVSTANVTIAVLVRMQEHQVRNNYGIILSTVLRH